MDKRSKSIAELAREQAVKPMPDVRDLWGTWPGGPDDGFEQSIDDLRRGRFKRSGFFLKPLKKGEKHE